MLLARVRLWMVVIGIKLGKGTVMKARWYWSRILSSGLLLIFLLCSPGPLIAQDLSFKPFDANDIGRIEELYHVMDRFAEDIWPGLDIRQLPIAINNHERQEDDIYYNLIMTTDGFTLKADKARLKITDSVVSIFPLINRNDTYARAETAMKQSCAWT